MAQVEYNKKDLAHILTVLTSKADKFEKTIDKTIRKVLLVYDTDEMIGLYPMDDELTLLKYKKYKVTAVISYEFLEITYILYKDGEEILTATKSNDEDIVRDEKGNYVTQPGKPYGYFVGLIASQLDAINVEGDLYNVLKQQQDSIVKDTVSPISYDKGDRISYDRSFDLGQYHITMNAVADLIREADGASDYYSLDVCYKLYNEKNVLIANGVNSEVYIKEIGDEVTAAEYTSCAEIAFTELLGWLLCSHSTIPE